MTDKQDLGAYNAVCAENDRLKECLIEALDSWDEGDWVGKANELLGRAPTLRHRFEQLQSALTRAEGRVRELEAETAEGKRLLSQIINNNDGPGWQSRVEELLNGFFLAHLRSQPPLASSVVADDATTGEESFCEGLLAGARGEPSPLTGEEGKADHVTLPGVAYELSMASKAFNRDSYPHAILSLIRAVRFLLDCMTARANYERRSSNPRQRKAKKGERK